MPAELFWYDNCINTVSIKNCFETNLKQRRKKMKQTLKTIIRNVKSIKGNSLAEFATTTALMATLAATAAPKLSEMSEGTKAEKSINEIDKIIGMAKSFYQKTADLEGRGRFPGQSKFNSQVGGAAYDNSDASSAGTYGAHSNALNHQTDILEDLGLGTSDGWQKYSDEPVNAWVSVFGVESDYPMADGTQGVSDCGICSEEWRAEFGDEELGSTFQDGHYAYTVVAGGGSGSDVFPPTLYVVDVENATDFNSVLEP